MQLADQTVCQLWLYVQVVESRLAVSRTSECQRIVAAVRTYRRAQLGSGKECACRPPQQVWHTACLTKNMEQNMMLHLAKSPSPIQATNERFAHITERKGFQFADGDAALVSSLASGDRGAFEVLVKRHQRRLFRTALNITNNREDAEDAVQDAFLKAFKHLDSFRGDSRFSTWLTRITINQAFMAMRAKPRKTTSLDAGCETEAGTIAYEIPASGYTPEQLCLQREFERLLFTVAAGMSKRLSSVWRLHTIHHLTEREIAHVLGVTVMAAKSRLFRAKHELRKRMENHTRSVSALRTVRVTNR